MLFAMGAAARWPGNVARLVWVRSNNWGHSFR